MSLIEETRLPFLCKCTFPVVGDLSACCPPPPVVECTTEAVVEDRLYSFRAVTERLAGFVEEQASVGAYLSASESARLFCVTLSASMISLASLGTRLV